MKGFLQASVLAPPGSGVVAVNVVVETVDVVAVVRVVEIVSVVAAMVWTVVVGSAVVGPG